MKKFQYGWEAYKDVASNLLENVDILLNLHEEGKEFCDEKWQEYNLNIIHLTLSHVSALYQAMTDNWGQ